MITIKVRRKNGKEHTFNVHKVVTTPTNDLVITVHYGINNELKMNKWAIGVGDTVYYNDTVFKVKDINDVAELKNTLIALKDNWKPCTKIEYDIQMYMPGPGKKVHNFLEDSYYETDDNKPVILVGTVGEEWTVQTNKLMKAYTYEGKPITEDIIKNKLSDGEKHTITAIAGAEKMFAYQTKEQQEVNTSWGETLKSNRDGIEHGDGDYIICASKDGSPNFDNTWVINGLIFPKTYKFI